MSKVIYLERDANGNLDMVLDNGSAKMAENGVAAGVRMQERLLLERTEAETNPLVANKKAGTQWYGIVFDPTKTRIQKELEIKRVILSTPGIRKILQWQFTQVRQSASFTARVQTDWGEDEIIWNGSSL